MRLLISIVTGLTVGAGCAVGPDPARPTTPVGPDATYLRATAGDATSAYDAAGWWRRFADPATTRLVRDVVSGNYDLRAAAARVDEADALLDAAGGELLPELSLSFTPSRQQRFLDIPIGTNQIDSEIYDARLQGSWNLDIWGRQRRAAQAAAFRLQLARANRLAVAHRVVAEALRARVRLAVLAERLRLAEDAIDDRRRTLEVVTDDYRAGLARAAELELARESLASARAGAPPLREALARAGHALAILQGDLPSTVDLDTVRKLPRLPELDRPPAGVPAALLDRRPDLLAAQFRAAANTAEVGVRVADLLPDVTLRANVGVANDEVSELLDGEVLVWTLAGEVVQSLFYRGVLINQVEAAEARARQAAARYVRDVLRAVGEVEDALVAETQTRLRLDAADDALGAAARAERLALRDYRQGLGSLLEVLDAADRRRAAEERQQVARRDVWVARINLHLALGGDWRLPGSPTPPPVPSEANADAEADDA